jgi:hypothetical protein
MGFALFGESYPLLIWSVRKALGNKAVKRSLHSDLFQMVVLGAD